MNVTNSFAGTLLYHSSRLVAQRILCMIDGYAHQSSHSYDSRRHIEVLGGAIITFQAFDLGLGKRATLYSYYDVWATLVRSNGPECSSLPSLRTLQVLCEQDPLIVFGKRPKSFVASARKSQRPASALYVCWVGFADSISATRPANVST